MLGSNLLVYQWIELWLTTKKTNDVKWAFHCLYRNMSASRDRQWEAYAKDAEKYLLQRAKRREHELVRELQHTIEHNAKMEDIILAAWNYTKNESNDLRDDRRSVISARLNTNTSTNNDDSIRFITGLFKLDQTLQSAQIRHQASAIQKFNVNRISARCKRMIALETTGRILKYAEKDRLAHCLQRLREYKGPTPPHRMRTGKFSVVPDDTAPGVSALLLRRDQNRFRQADGPATPRSARQPLPERRSPETQTLWCVPSTMAYHNHPTARGQHDSAANPTGAKHFFSPQLAPQPAPPAPTSLFAAAAAAALARRSVMSGESLRAPSCERKSSTLLSTPRHQLEFPQSPPPPTTTTTPPPAQPGGQHIPERTNQLDNWITQARKVTSLSGQHYLADTSQASVMVNSLAANYHSTEYPRTMIPSRGGPLHQRMPSNLPISARQSRSVSPGPRFNSEANGFELLSSSPNQVFSRGPPNNDGGGGGVGVRFMTPSPATTTSSINSCFLNGHNRHTISMR